MGLRGPARKPTALKVLNGNPGRRPINDQEPVFDPGKPTPPSYLPAEAKKEWRRIMPQLLRNGLFTVVDVPALVIYCKAWAHYLACEEYIAKHGYGYPVIDEKTKKLKYIGQFPQVSISRNSVGIIDKFAGKFGLTPSDRSSLKAPRIIMQAEVDDLFKNKNG